MTGLRERKKHAARTKILAAAIELFRSAGYEQATMGQIAARAEMSPPTLYSHFATKQALLVGVFWQARRDSRLHIDPILANPPADPVDAVSHLIVADMAELTSRAEKRMWREMLAALIRIHDQPRDEIYSYKFEFEKCLQEMLLSLIRSGRLSDQLDHQVAAKSLYAITWDVFTDLIADQDARPQDAYVLVAPQVKLILTGWIVEA